MGWRIKHNTVKVSRPMNIETWIQFETDGVMVCQVWGCAKMTANYYPDGTKWYLVVVKDKRNVTVAFGYIEEVIKDHDYIPAKAKTLTAALTHREAGAV